MGEAMPIYEYECGNCEEKFEMLRDINDSDGTVKCPCCGVKSARRLLSVFAAVSSSPEYGSADCAPQDYARCAAEGFT